MYKIIYTKFSEGRKKEYSVVTSVVEDEGKKHVIKSAQYDCGRRHIENMSENYKKYMQNNTRDEIQLCKCSRIDDNSVSFEYIDGTSYAEMIADAAKKHDCDKIIGLLQDIKTITTKTTEIVPFQKNDLFEEIFGDVKIDGNSVAGRPVNIDMIAENIISKQGISYIIDYEWILDCIVPLDFVLYRCVMHNMDIARLGSDFQDKIYDYFQISKAQRKLYEQMEERLQQHIKGDFCSLDELYKDMPNECYRLEYLDWRSALNRFCAYAEVNGKRQLVCQKIQYLNEFEECVDVSGFDQLELQLMQCNGIIKIKSIKGYAGERFEEEVSYETNANLIICDDYYFYENPVLKCDCSRYDTVVCSYTILDKNDRFIPYLADTLRENQQIKLQNESLQNEIGTMKNRKAWKLVTRFDRLRDKMRR